VEINQIKDMRHFAERCVKLKIAPLQYYMLVWKDKRYLIPVPPQQPAPRAKKLLTTPILEVKDAEE
jgi:hypothetical protein